MLKLPIIYGILFITNGRNEVGKLANYTKEQWNAKKGGLLERCFDCFAEYGLHGTGIRALAKRCGCTTNMLYTYFNNIDEIPYWTAEKHGKKYRIMYQVYTHPKYREYGMKFFEGVEERYTEYAKSLEGKLGIPHEKLTPLIFILVRACVHYALFENEFYLKSQIEVLKETLELFIEKYKRRKIK